MHCGKTTGALWVEQRCIVGRTQMHYEKNIDALWEEHRGIVGRTQMQYGKTSRVWEDHKNSVGIQLIHSEKQRMPCGKNTRVLQEITCALWEEYWGIVESRPVHITLRCFVQYDFFL